MISYLQIENLSKRFGEQLLFEKISFGIGKQQKVALIAKNGTGKSTLLQIIAGKTTPDSGSVTINNTDVFKLNDKNLSSFRNQYIGFVFQFHHLLPEFTAVENIALPALIKGSSRKNALKDAESLLEIFHLSDRSQHKPSELSGGEQQRVAIARALINNPKVVFADEPSGNLDSENALELHKLFIELRDLLHQTFIIVTHNQSLASMADRILQIKDGLIV